MTTATHPGQPGIFREGTRHHVFLEYACPSPPPRLPGRDLLDTPVAGVEQVVAVGSKCQTLLGDDGPILRDFTAVQGVGGVAPATQQDVFVWVHGEKRDEVFARALAWNDALTEVLGLAREEHGFLFRDSRDLTGFVDGTENPKGEDRFETALTTGQDAGGSFLLVQRWWHQLPAFHAQSVADQERVIGRTKEDSVQLRGDAMPPDSHVSRTDLPDTKIYRRSTPIGGVVDSGLLFLAFSAELERFERLLDSMFGNAEDGLSDRLLNFSVPITGSYYYAPSAARLPALFEPH